MMLLLSCTLIEYKSVFKDVNIHKSLYRVTVFMRMSFYTLFRAIKNEFEINYERKRIIVKIENISVSFSSIHNHFEVMTCSITDTNLKGKSDHGNLFESNNMFHRNP